MSGRRRAEGPDGRRRAVVVTGVVVAVSAACAVAVVLALGPGKGRPQASSSSITGTDDSPMNALQGSERDAVPDACATLSADIADSLAPGADRSATTHAAHPDQDSECTWSVFGATRSRQLNVELRAIGAEGPTSATNVAIRTFNEEYRSDRSGKDLADTATVKDSRGVSGVGEQAYVVYTVDRENVGTAVANVRLSNVLVTVRYSGGDDRDAKGSPLS